MSKFQSERDRDQAYRMKALQIPIKTDEFEERLIVCQDKEPCANTIASRYLTTNHMGLTLTSYLRVINNSEIHLTLCGFQVSLPWKDTPALLLQDPADPFAPQTYRFPGENSGGFDISQIIVQSGRTLTRGRYVEGFLLGYDVDPIPPSYRSGTELPVVLTIEDQFGEVYSNELFLAVDRSAERQPKLIPKPSRRRKRLFEKQDGLREDTQSNDTQPNHMVAACEPAEEE